MTTYPRHVEIDHARFAPSVAGDLEARYGLPARVEFCGECVISNQRPNSTPEFTHNRNSAKQTIQIDEDGRCDACRFNRLKEDIDWDERRRELRDLCDRHRRDDGRHDCIVSGSGGKDSFYTAHLLKYRYGMHPLTVTAAPHIYTPWGRENLEAWIHAGFDNFLVTPNGRVHRLLTRLALETLYHPFQPFILGQKNLAPKMALRHDIELVFYGENEAEYGNPIQDNETALRDWKYFTRGDERDVYLAGVSLADLKCELGLEAVDLEHYLPADAEALQKSGVQVHYMGYYERWHPQSAYYYAVEHGGFEAAPERTPGTYGKYSGIDDKIDDLHFYTTFVKFGIGRATYDAAQEVRNGDITREEAQSLVRRYDGEFPERFMDEVLDYLSLPPSLFPEASRAFEQPMMDRAYFDHLTDRARSPHLWVWQDGAWSLRHRV